MFCIVEDTPCLGNQTHGGGGGEIVQPSNPFTYCTIPTPVGKVGGVVGGGAAILMLLCAALKVRAVVRRSRQLRREKERLLYEQLMLSHEMSRMQASGGGGGCPLPALCAAPCSEAGAQSGGATAAAIVPTVSPLHAPTSTVRFADPSAGGGGSASGGGTACGTGGGAGSGAAELFGGACAPKLPPLAGTRGGLGSSRASSSAGSEGGAEIADIMRGASPLFAPPVAPPAIPPAIPPAAPPAVLPAVADPDALLSRGGRGDVRPPASPAPVLLVGDGCEISTSRDLALTRTLEAAGLGPGQQAAAAQGGAPGRAGFVSSLRADALWRTLATAGVRIHSASNCSEQSVASSRPSSRVDV